MKNAVIFHGTGGSPDAYWIPWLKTELEKQGYDVQVPQLPNTNSPEVSETLPFVLNNIQVDEDTVLVGHSSGGSLILSVLENIQPKVKRAILVAGFYKQLSGDRNNMIQDSYDWDKIKQRSKDFIFINSDNDPWGCDDKMGREMQSFLGGDLV